MKPGAALFGIALAVMVATGGIAHAQFSQTLFRGNDGTLYQVLQHTGTDDIAGITGVRITTLVGSSGAVSSCSSAGSPVSPVIAAEAASHTALSPGAFDINLVRSSAVINSGAAPVFDPTGVGTVTIGSTTVSRDGTLASITSGTNLPVATLNEINTTAPLQCATNVNRQVYTFSSTPISQTCTFDPPYGSGPVMVSEEATVCADVCSAKPADGFDLVDGICVNGSNDGTPCTSDTDCTGGGVCPTTGQSIVIVYPLLGTEPFQAAAAGFGFATDSSNTPGCAASPGSPAVILASSANTTAPVSSAPPCPATPLPGCRTPQKSILLMKNKTGNGPFPHRGNKLVWKWTKGAATDFADLGTPTAVTTPYLVCVYDEVGGTASLSMQAQALGGGTCRNGKPCWKQIGSATHPKGYKYIDSAGQPDGIRKILLKAGADGKSQVIVIAKGDNLTLPDADGSDPYLNQDTAVVVQISRGDDSSQCWEATLSSPATRNQDSRVALFKDACTSSASCTGP